MDVERLLLCRNSLNKFQRIEMFLISDLSFDLGPKLEKNFS